MLKREVKNPANSKVLYEYTYTSLEDTNNSISELKNKGIRDLKELSSFKKSEILLNLSDLISSRKLELATMITEETGKVFTESIAEVKRAVLTCKIASEEAKRISGESRLTNSFNAGEQRISITQRHPYGVAFCITPFNFPLNLAIHKIAPAFASGNCVLFKPSECNYKLGERLVSLCLDAGFPKTSIKLVMPNIDTLNQVVGDSRISIINFTGGTNTADKIAKLAGRKKLLLELGGNDALIVFPDSDINQAAAQAVAGRFGTCGQKCIANKRVFVHEAVYDQFKSFVLEYTSDFNYNFPEDPLKESAKLGPMISEEMAKKVEAIVERSIKNKANILVGHERINNFYKATVLENVLDEDELIKEETFGPVLVISKFNDELEVVRRVNSSPYGLQCGVFTKDIDLAKRLYQSVDVGTLYINQGPANRDEYLPFGGVKDSGMGREGVKNAIEEMTYIKQLII